MLNIESPRTVTIESITDPNFDERLKIWTKKLLGAERYTGIDMIHKTNLLTHSIKSQVFISRVRNCSR